MRAGTGVASTLVGSTMPNVGYASRELYAQFLARIKAEMPKAVVAMFSTLKYVNAPNFDKFRSTWSPLFRDGFVVDSRAFDGISGKFPIGFLIWDTGKARKEPLEVKTEVIDSDGVPIGAKTYYAAPKERLLNEWFKRPVPNKVPAVPLRNALDPTDRTTDVRGKWWADGAIGGMICNGSDMQHAGETVIFSSGYGAAGGYLITGGNIRQSAMTFTARRIVKPTWLNNRDQFLIPDAEPGNEFAGDCLIWTLFNSRNLAAGADGLQWGGKKWSLVNHFIPFTESEVNAPGRFESDFMHGHLASYTLSKEAKKVLAEGRTVWRAFFADTDDRATRTRLKLGRPDVGWHQIRLALRARQEAGRPSSVNTGAFESRYSELTDKILPSLFELGFLRP